MNRLLILVLSAVLISCSGDHGVVNVIPQPNSVVFHSGGFTIHQYGTIVAKDNLDESVSYLIEVADKVGVKLKRSSSAVGHIYVDTVNYYSNPEAYRINITGAAIWITGASRVGLCRAFNTLVQIGVVEGDRCMFPRMEIIDEPRFSYRGLHLDVSRHFYDIEDVKKVISYMARYKLNKFHWHLTDNEGWRVEIQKYPELTQKGAWRKLNNFDRECQTFEEIHSNSEFRIPRKYIKIEEGDTIYGGYYTQSQIREVIEFATRRGIDVIPEISMPGHLQSAIELYPYLSCKGGGVSGVVSDPLCVGNHKAMEFVKDVFAEIVSLFPYKEVHIGGDAVNFDVWRECQYCINLAKSRGCTTAEQLQGCFTQEIANFLKGKGKTIIGWDNIVDHNPPVDASIMWWRQGYHKNLDNALKNGYKAIISPVSHFSLNLPQTETTFREFYEFEPIMSHYTSQMASNVIGVQANLWTEHTPSIQRIQYHFYPRGLALAEMGWTKDKNWENFHKRAIDELKMLNALNVSYRLPDITNYHYRAAFWDTTEFAPKISIPNVDIRYTTDLSNPDADSKILDESIDVFCNQVIKFRAVRPDGSMGGIFTSRLIKENYAPALDVNPSRDGVFCHLYYFDNGTNCENISGSPLLSQFAADKIEIPAHVSGWIGMNFEGYFNARSAEVYTFKLTSDDGSQLYIDDKLVIDNDGSHSEITVTGQIVLDKGMHKVKVLYFDRNNGGVLNLSYKTPQHDSFDEMTEFKY